VRFTGGAGVNTQKGGSVEFGYTQSYVYRLLGAATIERNISPIGEIGTIRESQLRPLAPLEPEQQAEAWKQAVETAPNGRVTAAHVQDVVDAMRARSSGEPVDFDAYVASRPDEQAEPVKPVWYQSSESDDWWTPQWLFDMVSEEIAFETDVCASDANHKCGRYFTKEQDALAQDWTGALRGEAGPWP
jgi:hypothetical protein